MIDIKYIREDKEKVKENIRKKFQDEKLEIVDEIEKLDKEYRDIKKQGDDLRALKNSKSSLIGTLMREQKKNEAEKIKLVTTDETINKLAKYIHNVLGLRELNCNYDINQEKCRSCIKRTSKKI